MVFGGRPVAVLNGDFLCLFVCLFFFGGGRGGGVGEQLR